MFERESRYVSEDVMVIIPLPLIIKLWDMIDELDIQKDYIQIFKLINVNNQVRIIHQQDRPHYEHCEDYNDPVDIPAIIKIHVIDDGERSTMEIIDKYEII